MHQSILKLLNQKVFLLLSGANIFLYYYYYTNYKKTQSSKNNMVVNKMNSLVKKNMPVKKKILGSGNKSSNNKNPTYKGKYNTTSKVNSNGIKNNGKAKDNLGRCINISKSKGVYPRRSIVIICEKAGCDSC